MKLIISRSLQTQPLTRSRRWDESQSRRFRFSLAFNVKDAPYFHHSESISSWWHVVFLCFVFQSSGRGSAAGLSGAGPQHLQRVGCNQHLRLHLDLPSTRGQILANSVKFVLVLSCKGVFLQSYGAARENSFYFYFCCSILLVLNLVFNVCQSGEKNVFWRRRGKKVKMHHQNQKKKVSNVPLGSCTIRTYRTVFWQEK